MKTTSNGSQQNFKLMFLTSRSSNCSPFPSLVKRRLNRSSICAADRAQLPPEETLTEFLIRRRERTSTNEETLPVSYRDIDGWGWQQAIRDWSLAAAPGNVSVSITTMMEFCPTLFGSIHSSFKWIWANRYLGSVPDPDLPSEPHKSSQCRNDDAKC